MANELTERFGIPKPAPSNDIADDVIALQQAFDIVDQALALIADAAAGKAPAEHGHTIDQIAGLVDALAGKMPNSKTFALTDLTDVLGAADALNNYILSKSGSTYVFRSAASVLDQHTHAIANVTGLQAVLNTLLAGASSSGDAIIAVYDGATGKNLKPGGYRIADLRDGGTY